MNQEVQSKVKNVQGAGTWESPHGLLYSFEYAFEDGTVLKANHKRDQPFAAGEEVTYIVTKENHFGKSGKVSKGSFNAPPAQNRNTPSAYQKPAPVAGNSGGKNAAFALSYAKDIMVAVGGEVADQNELADHTLALAERFNIWLNNN